MVGDFRFTHAGRVIEVAAGDAPVVGDWDQARLRRVVANLLANALKYSPAGGPVRLALWPVDRGGRRWAQLDVTDEGIGIPARELEQVFDWFARGRNARHARIQGTGIGLAGVRQIVEQHGGEITVASEENRGSTFTVRLPADA
ncbi:MAG: ATP-binding protein [Myxococcales bacterium]|nr:MAG: ATP-binding protein [Myxococcales bacterium]